MFSETSVLKATWCNIPKSIRHCYGHETTSEASVLRPNIHKHETCFRPHAKPAALDIINRLPAVPRSSSSGLAQRCNYLRLVTGTATTVIRCPSGELGRPIPRTRLIYPTLIRAGSQQFYAYVTREQTLALTPFSPLPRPSCILELTPSCFTSPHLTLSLVSFIFFSFTYK